MRVLWFSNTPALGEEYINNTVIGGGWLKSLDKIMQEHVELHISFYYPYRIEPFVYKKTTYHPIKRGNLAIDLIKRKLFNFEPDDEDLSLYFEVIKRVKPDIIHIHGTENPFGCIIGKTDIPVVVSIQGNITVCFHKFCSGIEYKFLGTRPYFTGLKNFILSQTFKHDYNLFVKKKKRELRNLAKCRNIIGRTSWDKRIMSVMAPGNHYFHGDEILRDSFYETCWKPSHLEVERKFIIHTTNGNSYYKGFETLCSTLNELNKLGFNAEWRVAGVKSSDLIVKIVRKKLGDQFPEKNLILLGSVNEQELLKKLLEADVYVMTSHIENSPNNLCEAMMLGMPCIATFVGGTSSILENDREGVLIQDGDPWSMAGAIIELSGNKELAYQLGQNARKRSMIRHDKVRIARELLVTYNTIINRNK